MSLKSIVKFNDHSELEGEHSFLSASKYNWINYDEKKMARTYKKSMAKEHGTRLHAFAKDCISLGQKLPDTEQTLNMYVNDSIGYGMTPEQVLYYSPNAFGTADSICFENNVLRIFDLKTGTIPAHVQQLEVYAAYFCLEYGKDPEQIDMDLRLYQNNVIVNHEPNPETIQYIMDKIIDFDQIINNIRLEG